MYKGVIGHKFLALAKIVDVVSVSREQNVILAVVVIWWIPPEVLNFISS